MMRLWLLSGLLLGSYTHYEDQINRNLEVVRDYIYYSIG